MQTSCDVSVFIPLYNTEKFIRQCIDSVLAQTFTDFEIMIVDDGSTDNGSALYMELYGNDDRVNIICHDQILGLGAARDTGTFHAKGRYICYAYSDDEIMPYHLGDMFSVASEYDADVVHNTHNFSPIPDENGVYSLKMPGVPEGHFISYSADKNALTELTVLTDDLSSSLNDRENYRYQVTARSSLYKKTLLNENNITFNKLRYAEDILFSFQCLFKARRFAVRPGGSYIYKLADTSLSRPKNQAEKLVKALRAQFEIIEIMRRITDNMPFFMDNEDNVRLTVDTLLLMFEGSRIRLAFQSLGADKARTEESIHAFFAENFGEKAPYVEFLFHELHKLYPPIIDYVDLAKKQPKEWRNTIKK